MSEALLKARQAKEASEILQGIDAAKRSEAIFAMANALLSNSSIILDANAKDVVAAKNQNFSDSLIDRLLLDESRIEDIAENMKAIARQKDLIGTVLSGSKLASGINIKKVVVPMGVIAMIYEARPNVTADAAALAIRTANAVVLRGGSIAVHSNQAITQILQDALVASGLPKLSVQSIESTDRSESLNLMQLSGLIDLLIPRGGSKLIQTVLEHAKVPVIETGTGNNHIYVHADANIIMSKDIIINAKTQRTGVCNAVEHVLIDKAIAQSFIPQISQELLKLDVKIHADKASLSFIDDKSTLEIVEEDYSTEYLARELSISIVDGLDEAVKHINQYGSKHSEAIVTQNYEAAKLFSDKVDAACVYVNASTRFSDGAIFGLGAEIGISTQKLHARGPMGAEALVSAKYICEGTGQIREH